MSAQIGATAVGIKARDGVVLAADKRMSYGSFVLSRNAKKVFPITNRAGAAVAGLYGDISGLMKLVDAEVRRYEASYRTVMPLRAIAKFLSVILYSSKYFPYMIEAIVGGIDGDGKPRVYVLDPVGAITEEDYIAVGSGATMALGVIEVDYKEEMSVKEARDLAIKAVRAAISRDAGSGDGVDLLVVSDKGVREESLRFRVTMS